MLIIRPEQLEPLGISSTGEYQRWLECHLRRFFPEHCAAMTDSMLQDTIRLGMGKAARYGLQSRRDICRFMDAMFALGAEFDQNPAIPWAGEILRSKHMSPSMRAFALVRRLQREVSAAAARN
jgi:hypothetical protein